MCGLFCQDLSSSEDEIGEEEYDRSASHGVARRVSYKIRKNEKGETELHVACIQGNFKRVKSLIERVCVTSRGRWHNYVINVDIICGKNSS